MNKTIRITGVGTATAAPDYVQLTLSLETLDKDYATAMERAATDIQHLTDSLTAAGLNKDAVKTTAFHVDTDYSSEKDRYGNYHRVFNGYEVRHRLSVRFDFIPALLATVLTAVANCVAQPELSVAFTVKDPTAINEQLLTGAATHARRKAEVLCAAAGVTLGSLVRIDHSWSELDVYSHTEYNLMDKCMADASAPGFDFQPEDIKVSDNVTFEWEIA